MAGEIEIVEEAETAVEKQQHGRNYGRGRAARDLAGKDEIAAIDQRAHERARQDNRQLQRGAEEQQRRAHRVGEDGIAQRRAGEDVIIRRQRRTAQTGDDGKMHAKVAVRRLPRMQRAARLAQRVRVLQIAGQNRQRQGEKEQRFQQRTVLRRKFRRCFGALAREKKRRQRQRHHRGQRAIFRRKRKPERVGEQRGQPHQTENSKRRARPDANQRAFIPKQRARAENAARKIKQKHKNSRHNSLLHGDIIGGKARRCQ